MTEVMIATRVWRDFQDNPLPGVHKDYLLDALHPLRLDDKERFQAALGGQQPRMLFVELLRRKHALPSLTNALPSGPDAALSALSVAGWQDAVRACGLMYWSNTLAREVRGPVLAHITQAFGDGWWHWVELGRSETIGTGPSLPAHTRPDHPHAWQSTIEKTGQALLGTWQDGLDADVAAWIKLKTSPASAETPPPWQIDTAYGRRLLHRLGTSMIQDPETR